MLSLDGNMRVPAVAVGTRLMLQQPVHSLGFPTLEAREGVYTPAGATGAILPEL